MDKHTKKTIVPVIVTVAVIIYMLSYVIAWVYLPLSVYLKILALLMPLGISCGAIGILADKSKEKGAEDDLSKY